MAGGGLGGVRRQRRRGADDGAGPRGVAPLRARYFGHGQPLVPGQGAAGRQPGPRSGREQVSLRPLAGNAARHAVRESQGDDEADRLRGAHGHRRRDAGWLWARRRTTPGGRSPPSAGRPPPSAGTRDPCPSAARPARRVRSAPGARWSPETRATASAAVRWPTVAAPSSRARASRGSVGTRARILPSSVAWPSGVDGAEFPQHFDGLVHRGLGRRVRQRQPPAAGGSPARQDQGGTGQVCGRDLRRLVGRRGAEGPLVIAADHRARALAGGTAGALFRGRPGAGHRHEAGHPAAGVAPRLAGQPGVDDQPDARDGEGGLGERGGDDDPGGPAGLAPGDGAVLLRRAGLPVEFQDLGAGSGRAAAQQRRRPPTRPGRTPGRQGPVRQPARRRARPLPCRPRGPGRPGSRPVRPAAAPPRGPIPRPAGTARTDSRRPAPGRRRRRFRRRPASPIRAAKRGASRVADMATSVRSPRSWRTSASMPSEQVGLQPAFVDLVEDHGVGALQPRVREEAAQQDARGDELDHGAGAGLAFPADRVAHAVPEPGAVQGGQAPGGRRAATRRGWVTTIRGRPARSRAAGDVGQQRRHQRRLARARRRLHHRGRPGTPALQRRGEIPQRVRKSQARPDDAEVEEALGAGWVQGCGRGSHASIVSAIHSWPCRPVRTPSARRRPCRGSVPALLPRRVPGLHARGSGASVRWRRHGFRPGGCRLPGQRWSPSASPPSLALPSRWPPASWHRGSRQPPDPYSSGVRGPPGPACAGSQPGKACTCTPSRSAFPTAAGSGIPSPPARCRLPG